MISVSDFRRGLPIMVEDQPYYIVEYNHFKMGRGGANIRTKLKHIITGQVVEKVFGTNDTFKPPDLENRRMQYMYENGGEYAFMDSQTYDQIAIAEENLGDSKWYLLEHQEYIIQFLDGRPINVDMPASVVLKVIETDPI